MPRIALVTAIAAHALDDDMPPLLASLQEAGLHADVRAWDDLTVSWSRYDIVLLRSPWDYTMRLDAFLAWCERISSITTLLNPLDVVRWNTDKRYMAQLESIAIAIVPTDFGVPGDDAAKLIAECLATHPDAAEIVIKPTVGAGSRDAKRHRRDAVAAMRQHVQGLFDKGRGVLLQPYLPSVDSAGETALMYFDGIYSHAIRKGALLRPDEDATRALFAAEHIQSRIPDADERALADRIIAALPQLVDTDYPLAYARVDLIRAADGSPCVLELELAEPSLFLATDADAGARFAAVLRARLAAMNA
jgi:glutathione synthase/RimK-type ligase-like ATP-grasp enzyme